MISNPPVTPEKHRQLIEENIKLIEERFPGLWRYVYPRLYSDIGSFPSPKLVAIEYGASIMGMGRAPILKMLPDTLQCSILIAYEASKHHFPLYFVSRDFIKALLETTPPREVSWVDMPLPHSGASFLLERGALQHPTTRSDVSFISYARCGPGEVIRFPLDHLRLGQGITPVQTSFYCQASITSGEDPASHHQVFAGDRTIIRFDELDHIVRSERRISAGSLAAEAIDGDFEFVSMWVKLLLNLLLAMEDRPQLKELGGPIGKRSKGSNLPFWTPNFIGRRYRYRRSTETGNGTSPRMHWRRGHWRDQLHGPKLSLVKKMWIEPVLVNAE
jgi:hypothetical protein